MLGLNAISGGDDIYIGANLFALGSEAPPEVDDPIDDEELDAYIDQDEDEKAVSDIDFKPTSSMAEEAQRGLDWRKKFKRGGTAVGVARANQLTNRENLSPSTVKRMYSFFSRHEVDKQGQGYKPSQEGYPSAGRIAWALWGGDAGFSWATKKRNQIEAELGKD